MPKLSLTDRAVATAKPGDLFDTITPGLNIRIAASGVRTWFLVYSAPNGKRARVKLGRYPEMSLVRARALAVEMKQSLQEGRDPRQRGAAGAGAMTVASLIADYLAKHVRQKLRSSKQVERRLLKNVMSVIGDTKLAELHRRDIHRCLDQVVERGSPIEALKVFKDCRAMLKWAVGRGDLDACPMDGMKPPASENVRERALSDDEIATVWNSVELLTRPAHRAVLKLCLLTGQRIGEVAGMCRDEVDLRTGTWTIPAERSKNKNKHTVPLSDAALAIVKGAMGKGDRICLDGPGNVGKHITRAPWGVAHFTPHDLRRTAVTRMAELGVTPIVLGHVINHRSVTKAGVTLAVYSHYTYEKEKRDALQMWADRLAAIVSGTESKIIQMRGAIA